MIELLTILAVGFFLGMRHATDPDHVIAVSTIVSRERSVRAAMLIGAFWGLGHTMTILGVGSAIVLFNLVIPPRLGVSMELCVGLMLILLGVLSLSGFRRFLGGKAGADRMHSHPHSHGDYVHAHPHQHEPDRHPHSPEQTPLARLDRTFGSLRPYQAVRPLMIGVVHGLAGSAAIALLVLATIRNSRWAIGYLLIFGIGTMAGMMLITAAIGSSVSYTQTRFQRFGAGLATAAAVLSLGFGLFLAYRAGFVNGLFTTRPQWLPR
ncbi:MAG: high-affinity nickel-transport family protein [Terriglobales bacterium]